jgi:hypothetical protein
MSGAMIDGMVGGALVVMVAFGTMAALMAWDIRRMRRERRE